MSFISVTGNHFEIEVGEHDSQTFTERLMQGLGALSTGPIRRTITKEKTVISGDAVEIDDPKSLIEIVAADAEIEAQAEDNDMLVVCLGHSAVFSEIIDSPNNEVFDRLKP